jgi:hypothetical protein
VFGLTLKYFVLHLHLLLSLLIHPVKGNWIIGGSTLHIIGRAFRLFETSCLFSPARMSWLVHIEENAFHACSSRTVVL